MSGVEESWERLVRAALRGGRVDASVTPSIREIDDILYAADGIIDYDPIISRILCEMAYLMTQKLDPNYVRRGVIQFKTGIMKIQKLKFRKIDRSQDVTSLQEFYELYRKKLHEEEMKLRGSGDRSGNIGKQKRNLATLKSLENALKQPSKDISPHEAERLIPIPTREQPDESIHPLPTMVIPRQVPPPNQKEFLDLRYQTPLCHCLQSTAVRVIGPTPSTIHEGRLFCICPNVRCDYFSWLSPSKVMFDRSISISKEVTPRFDGLDAKYDQILAICKEMQANVKRNEEFTGKWMFCIMGILGVIMSYVLFDKLM